MLKVKFKPFPEITTQRLLLRKLKQSDAPEFFFLRSDREVLKYIDRLAEKRVQQTRAHIKKLHQFEKDNEGITWAITEKGKKKLIGTICFWNIKKEHYRAEIGYALHPNFQGKGIMNEAMKAVLELGFKKYKFHSVEANVNPNNKASIKLLEKNKFVREAYYRENYFFRGKFLDSAVYSKLSPHS